MKRMLLLAVGAIGLTAIAGCGGLSSNTTSANGGTDSKPINSCTAAPNTPGSVTASAVSSSQITVSWAASSAGSACSVSYNVFRSTTSGFAPSSSNQVATGITGTSFGDTALTASSTYYYVVEAVDSAGASGASSSASATTPSATISGVEIVAIHSGGPAVSNTTGGDTSFVADEFYTGGGTSTSTNLVSTSGVTNAAPESVYQTERNGTFTYTIPGLTPGGQYTALLHFAETYFTAAGDRVFNVAINGTTVLNNFDIYAVAGGNKALVEQFTATANSSGQIVIAYMRGSNDQPKSSGIEIRGASSPCTLAPFAAPTGLTATAHSPSIIGLSWTGVAPPPNCAITYNLYGSTTSGFTPSASNLIASGLNSPNYSNTGLTASTTYYYVVEAVDAAGSSTPSAQASDETHSATSCVAVPSAPTDLVATPVSSSVIGLSWTAITPPANCTNITYNLYASTTDGFAPTLSNQIASGVTGTTFYHSNLSVSTTYYYVVEAADEDGVSAGVSAQASATTQAPPSTLTATAVSPNEIDLIWPASTLAAPVTYSVFRSTTQGFTPSSANQIGSTKSNAFQDVLASGSTTYYYMVKASNPSGGSALIGPANATTLAQGQNSPFWDASNIPPTPTGDVMMFKILNRTNGRYPDSQVYWNTTINGVTTTHSIADQATFAMPANSSGRMQFYLGSSGTNSPYADFIEFTIGLTQPNGSTYFFNGDTSRVDAFGIKLAFRLTCSDGTDIAVGENSATFAEDRAATFQRFVNAVPSQFQQLAQTKAPYQIVNPGGGGFDTGGVYSDYYTAYINEIWASNGLTIPLAGPNGDGLGNNPDLSAAIYRHTAAPGTFTPDGKLISQAMWGNPSNFYQQAPADYYAQFWHANAINGQQYAFPYDDAGGYSSDVSCNSPETLVIAVGW